MFSTSSHPWFWQPKHQCITVSHSAACVAGASCISTCSNPVFLLVSHAFVGWLYGDALSTVPLLDVRLVSTLPVDPPFCSEHPHTSLPRVPCDPGAHSFSTYYEAPCVWSGAAQWTPQRQDRRIPPSQSSQLRGAHSELGYWGAREHIKHQRAMTLCALNAVPSGVL